jgi:hypothetical protein
MKRELVAMRKIVTPQSLRLGAGRSQVQILSPRLLKVLQSGAGSGILRARCVYA